MKLHKIIAVFACGGLFVANAQANEDFVSPLYVPSELETLSTTSVAYERSDFDGADAKATAEAMKSGIDQRKWICVEADDLKVSAKGDTVMLIMVDSEYKESISAASVTEAFKTVCGGSLDFEI